MGWDVVMLMFIVRVVMMLLVSVDIREEFFTEVIVLTFWFRLDLMVLPAGLTSRKVMMIKHTGLLVLRIRFLSRRWTPTTLQIIIIIIIHSENSDCETDQFSFGITSNDSFVPFVLTYLLGMKFRFFLMICHDVYGVACFILCL
jgi:hypothetical protein